MEGAQRVHSECMEGVQKVHGKLWWGHVTN